MTRAAAPLRLAVLGTDHVHLPDYLEVVARDPMAVLTAVYSDRPAPVAGIRPARTAAEALAGADAAVIVSTTAQHGTLLRQAVRARVPALIEKPLAASAEETGRLAVLLAAAERPVTTAMFLRCAPELREVRARLAERALGELAGVHLRFTHPGLLDGVFTGPAAWMLAERHGATGAFADLAVHLVDLLEWLDPSADLRVCGAAYLSRSSTGLNAGGAAVLSWGGVPVTLQAGWTSRPGGMLLHIEGTHASVTVEPRLRAGAALEAFLGQLRGDPRWEPPTAREIVRTARVLDAVDRAARTEPE
ncbi:Gfo/Idh/MocA family oxidoreductase [Streptomyces sp. CSDS2]|uniref:Gfo/Idh/MocA family protein n=1 Tax=Streptomyces sp. CSDS2 TaxID=3055051 RepID=UPI0025AF6C7F|nr:Gfo/Idh/MocA family oxidoreductase [Streptomyces sp. CSDS2]MDN3265898.1 Gfo/Idh/MocA family oxidoreductase [Streptomyces sp. CSDS2]